MKTCAICKTQTMVNLYKITWKRRSYSSSKMVCTYCSPNYLLPALVEISSKVLSKGTGPTHLLGKYIINNNKKRLLEKLQNH